MLNSSCFKRGLTRKLLAAATLIFAFLVSIFLLVAASAEIWASMRPMRVAGPFLQTNVNVYVVEEATMQSCNGEAASQFQMDFGAITFDSSFCNVDDLEYSSSSCSSPTDRCNTIRTNHLQEHLLGLFLNPFRSVIASVQQGSGYVTLEDHLNTLEYGLKPLFPLLLIAAFFMVSELCLIAVVVIVPSKFVEDKTSKMFALILSIPSLVAFVLTLVALAVFNTARGVFDNQHIGTVLVWETPNSSVSNRLDFTFGTSLNVGIAVQLCTASVILIVISLPLTVLLAFHIKKCSPNADANVTDVAPGTRSSSAKYSAYRDDEDADSEVADARSI
eukprot:ANDGO_08613.mRNA.1 hypothetical protein